jgi:hypothetical protein
MKKEYQTQEQSESMIKRYLDRLNNNIYTIKGQDGNLLPTQIAYSFFVDYFSQLASVLKEERPNIKLINSSTGGAQIDGFENIDLKTAIKNAPVVKKLNLENIEPNYDKNHALEKISALYDEFYKVDSIINKIRQIASSFLSMAENENEITEKMQVLIEEQKNLLDEILNYNNDKIVKSVLEEIIKTYYDNRFAELDKDFKTIKEFEELVLKPKKDMHTTKRYLIILANCKSFILQ